MFAYFIGGPEDLTKRVIQEAPPYLNFAEFPPIQMSPVPELMPDTVVAKRHTYVRMRMSPRGDIVTYVWDRLL